MSEAVYTANLLSAEEKRALLARLLRERAAAEPEEAVFPLSHGQEALWVLHRLAPFDPTYNEAFAWRVRVEIFPEALRRAMDGLLARHPALRTTLEERDGRILQRVRSAGSCDLADVDASRWSEEEVARYLTEEARHPFDLERGPLVRVRRLARGAAESILFLAVHHMAVDLWSILVLLEDLRELYAAAAGGRAAALPPVRSSYREHVRRQRALVEGPEGEELWEAWSSRLAGVPTLLELPTDRPRPETHRRRGATLTHALPEGLNARVRELAKAEGATLFHVLLTVYQELLHRYSGQEGFLVGSPVSGRSRAETEGVVGYFVNMVPLRADLAGDPAFREHLQRVRGVVLDALRHQDYPFPVLVDRLQPERQAGRSPLFQVAFVWEAAPRLRGNGEAPSLAGAVLESYPLHLEGAKFDLTLMVLELDGQLSLALQYNADLWDAATVGRMAGHFERLLHTAVAAPESRLSSLPWLTAEEERWLAQWNGTEAAAAERTLSAPELFAARAEADPGALAVSGGGLRLTYGELAARAHRLARHLRSLGAGPESRVGLCLERSPDLIVAMLAVVEAGAAYVPLDTTYPAERLGFMLRDAGAALVVTRDGLLPEAVAWVRVVDLEADSAAIAACGSAPPDWRRPHPEELAYVIYTSGSTGRPKGVEVPHQGLANLVTWHRAAYALGPGCRVGQTASPAFDASTWEIWACLAAGASLHLAGALARFSPAELVPWLAAEGITHCFLPTPVAEALLSGELPPDLPLRCLLTGGDRLRRAPEGELSFRFANHYGPTESSVVATVAQVSPGRTAGAPPIGRPIDNLRVHVAGRRLLRMPAGIPGELCIAGQGLARGYHGQPALTAERFVPDPWSPQLGGRLYRTGDLVRLSLAGELEFLGRIDQQVKIRGFRIELGEIEATLAAHPAVAQALVGVRETGGHPRLVAGVVPASGAVPTPAELRAFLRASLPDYMVPSSFAVLDALPLTPNGKVDRSALPEVRGEEPGSLFAEPQTRTEQEIAKVWRDVLGLARAGRDDNFFDLGGSSLLMLEAQRRLERDLGRSVAVVELFQRPTIRSLAELLDGGREEAPRFEQSQERARLHRAAALRQQQMRRVHG